MSSGIRWLAERKLSWGFVSRQRFVLHASKVAVAAGMHKYQQRNELELELRETCAAPSSDIDPADQARLSVSARAAVAAAVEATLAIGGAANQHDALAAATARVADARNVLAVHGPPSCQTASMDDTALATHAALAAQVAHDEAERLSMEAVAAAGRARGLLARGDPGARAAVAEAVAVRWAAAHAAAVHARQSARVLGSPSARAARQERAMEMRRASAISLSARDRTDAIIATLRVNSEIKVAEVRDEVEEWTRVLMDELSRATAADRRAADDDAIQRIGRALGLRLGERGEPVVRARLGLDDALAPASGCAPYVTSREPVVQNAALYLGGRLDGLRRGADGSLTIVEIKTRVNRLLGVPTYERVQIHAYMFIHGARRGRLVENFGSQVVEHVVDFDDVFWAGVTAALSDFWQRVLDLRPAE